MVFSDAWRTPAKLRWLPWFAFVLVALDAFVPLTPFMPRDDLDGSWIFGLNQAVAQNLSFGRELVFTFGPYASIFTRTYDPATVTRMFAGSAMLAAVYLLCMALLVRRREGRWPAVVCSGLALLLSGADSLLLSLPLLVSLVVLSLMHEPRDTSTPPANWRLPAIAMVLASFGLLPLIKGTLALLCAVMALLCAAALVNQRRWIAVAVCLISPTMAMMAFWLLAGQALPDLLAYLANLRYIVSGYSEAMAVDGPVRELVLFLLPTGLLLAALATQGKLPRSLRLATLAAYALFLFISFKASFVRHDVHSNIAFANLLAAMGMLWPSLPAHRFQSRGLLVALVASTALCTAYLSNRTLTSTGLYAGATSNPLRLRTSYVKPSSWQPTFVQTKQSFAPRCLLDGVPHISTDIYSYRQSCLLAMNLPWSPRPVLQSYSAYTPELARMNEAHLRGADAPRQLLFRLETIDERLPALDDGLSLPAMLDNYKLSTIYPGFLLLSTRPVKVTASQYQQLGTTQARLGQTIDVPARLPVFVELTIRPTLWGKLLALAYKPPMLHLHLTLADGRKVTHRVNANMMESGFFLSPLLTTNNDVAALFDSELPTSPSVRSVSLTSTSALPLWQNDYVVSFKRYIPKSSTSPE